MVTTAWLRRTVSYGAAAMMTLFGLTGVVSAQTITNTGPGSRNTISSNYTNNCSVRNNNNVSAQNSNSQSATTGNVNESGNTSAGISWAGWSGLDPAAAQANGTSYANWWSGVVNWMSQRAGGNGWNSNQTNLSWTPSGADWNGFDPLAWQSNGQSFGNWYNAVENYLNSNNGAWLLSWPADATGTGNFGTMSGNATNNYNANFSININNAARAAAGTDSCGQSNFSVPPVTGGMGGGPAGSAPAAPMVRSSSPLSSGSGSGSGGYYGGSSYYAPVTSHASTPVKAAPAVSAPVSTSAPAPVGGMGGGAPAPAPASSISNTGPGSTNTVSSNYTNNSSVTNNNNVSVASTSNQTASTGSTNASGNTTTGGGGSGNAANGNASGTGVGISN